jgi:TetR/AcrR family transcriptional regulator, mexJK operon transcriptional repressor
MPAKNFDNKKHNAIIKAATRLFLKQGYGKTTMDQVAKDANVTKQTVYSHFGNKDKLFSAMITGQCKKHTPSDVILNSDMPFEELMFKIGLGFLEMITSKEGLATTRLVMSEAERKPKLAELFYKTGPQQMNKILTDFLELQNKNGLLRIPNTESAASYFFSMLKGRYHLRMALKVKPLPTKKELEEHTRETVRVFLKIYGGDFPLITNDIMS